MGVEKRIKIIFTIITACRRFIVFLTCSSSFSPDFCWQAKVVPSHPALEWSDKWFGNLTQGTVFWVINSFHWYKCLNLAFFSKLPSECLQNSSVPDKCHPYWETFKDAGLKKWRCVSGWVSFFFLKIYLFLFSGYECLPTCMLRTEFGSPGRVASTLNCKMSLQPLIL